MGRAIAVRCLAGAFAGGLVFACAPKEAAYEVSERAAAAPAPTLVPTAAFDAPTAEGAAATTRIALDRAALQARAAALRGRAAGLSATPLTEAERARLLAAGTASEMAPQTGAAD